MGILVRLSLATLAVCRRKRTKAKNNTPDRTFFVILVRQRLPVVSIIDTSVIEGLQTRF